MKISKLASVLHIEDYSNTRINDELCSLFRYAKLHPDEQVKSIYVQDNGVVRINTKKKK